MQSTNENSIFYNIHAYVDNRVPRYIQLSSEPCYQCVLVFRHRSRKKKESCSCPFKEFDKRKISAYSPAAGTPSSVHQFCLKPRLRACRAFMAAQEEWSEHLWYCTTSTRAISKFSLPNNLRFCGFQGGRFEYYYTRALPFLLIDILIFLLTTFYLNLSLVSLLLLQVARAHQMLALYFHITGVIVHFPFKHSHKLYTVHTQWLQGVIMPNKWVTKRIHGKITRSVLFSSAKSRAVL